MDWGNERVSWTLLDKGFEETVETVHKRSERVEDVGYRKCRRRGRE